MKTIILSSLVVAALFTGCKKKDASCEDLYDHTMSLLPSDMKDQIAKSKDSAMAKCEKASPEARQCAMDAQSMEDLMKCPK